MATSKSTSSYFPGQSVQRTGRSRCGVKTGGVYTVTGVLYAGTGTEQLILDGHPGRTYGSEFFAALVDPVQDTTQETADIVSAPVEQDLKPTNPKDAIGNRKLQLGLVPFAFQALTALALTDGKYKYGAHNWTIGGVRASIYIDAAMRHLQRWNNGQAFDPDSGVHNLGHAAACIAILLDAETRGVLNDDRPPAMPVGVLDSFQQYANRHTGELIDGHVAAGRAPRHWTIADGEGSGDAD